MPVNVSIGYLAELAKLFEPLTVVVEECPNIQGDAFTLRCVDDASAPVHCSLCGVTCKRKGHLPARRVRHLDYGGKKLFVEFASPRVACSVHGVGMALQKFCMPRSAFSMAFEDHVVTLVADDVSAVEIASKLHIHPNALRRALSNAYRRNRARKGVRNDWHFRDG